MKAGIVLQLHYLDDFLSYLHHLAGSGTQLQSHVLDTLASLGVPVAENKIKRPATTITFLGIQTDTISFEVRLTAEKLEYISRLAGHGGRVALAETRILTCSLDTYHMQSQSSDRGAHF